MSPLFFFAGMPMNRMYDTHKPQEAMNQMNEAGESNV
jgi:hypothetical protein